MPSSRLHLALDLLAIVAAVFAAATMVTLAFDGSGPVSGWLGALLRALLMSVLLAPVLYIGVRYRARRVVDAGAEAGGDELQSRLSGGMHQRVRVALFSVLVLVAAVVIGQQQQGEWLEHERAVDTEIVGLAGRQGMWSQQIARLAALLQTQPDDRDAIDSALQQAVAESQVEARRLSELVDVQTRSSPTAAALLRPALHDWQEARERLWYRSDNVRRSLIEREGPEWLRAAVVALQIEVEPALDAAQTLAVRSSEAARARSDEAIGAQRSSALYIAAMLIFLALGVAEPTARAVRRQTRQLAAQADELARLALVAERTHLAVILTDEKGRIVWINEGFARITGYGAAEVIGQHPVRMLLAGGADPAAVQRIRQAQADGAGVRVEVLSRTREGRDFWLDLDLQPLRDGAGALSGFVGVASDVTERVTERLKTAALLAALPTGVLMQDEHGKSVECNPAALRMLELTRDQVLRHEPLPPHWKVLNEDLSECLMADRPGTIALRSGEGLHGRILGVTRADGELRWLMVNAEPVIDALGRSAGVVSCFIDVTEQRNQRVLLEMTVDSAGVGTWQWDMASGHFQCNDRLVTMLGYRPGDLDLEGDNVLESLVHPDDRQPRRDALALHLANPAVPFRCEQRLRRPDGDWATVLSCGTVIERGDQGQPRRLAGLHFDMTEQMQMQAMLRHAARTDGLTQLPNRAAVFDRVQQALQRSQEQAGFGYAVLFMDFDRFKQVNDTLGHAVGDELLRQIAQRLRRTLRPGDVIGHDPAYEHTAGRIGGDEFVVVLEHVRGRDDACAVARRMLERLAEPYRIGPHVVHSTASIGIVTSEQAANDAHTVMRDADTAMYEAKRGGRGRYVVFDPSMHERVARGLAIENDLRLALERDELFVVYQPVVDFSAGRAGAVEALARWRHPTRGLVTPAEFIPVAEESGLIVELGRRVLDTACRQFVAWQHELGVLAPQSIAVNLSTVQLRHAGLVADVQACLDASGIAPSQLQLEVTESLAAQDEVARTRLRELKALGLTIALDDFGTGYSSLACLHQLPVDTVKIDRSFVSHAETSEYHRALIEATIRVAQTLGMSTVAEGIESSGQAALLQQMQCGRGQGYLYSRPLEAAALTHWLRSHGAPLAAA
ncbi:EAL domain-containing protein [Aquincola sp. S2]|uniref:EAL domain-containing protein n=1 Tax=Pseudaquabacterium terrae TaxID=2732868 RepID=A0ABX2EL60_9BURK|nr:EAL domain-containing protein [Aquabacterium terrae]NRF69378.1 EAL domain-containing protein [Aquabacterium terrae]